jgi:hemin uptake protein HemP
MNKNDKFSLDANNSGLLTNADLAESVRPRIRSAELFGKAREVVIEHAGEEYRLRLTRQDKLILTK